jgi:hypothetical protein
MQKLFYQTSDVALLTIIEELSIQAKNKNS